ncbi:MAG: hypothetical protein M4D80_12110 [Myxococcota bacterium]|nr:hypothetical protein [Myxococcota bacterium]
MKKLASFALVLLAGCPADEELEPQVTLHALTKPPPASVGTLTTNRFDEIYEIKLSQGVALAVGCSELCEAVYGACAAPELVAGDQALLGVRPLYRLNGGAGERVIIAKKVGTTTLTATSACGVQTYVVHITPRPTGSE